ncbi:MAG: signal peptidase II [Lachnospiraceae bacterium]|nr:signal peptidase II [Lachnospiraceae bacterium]
MKTITGKRILHLILCIALVGLDQLSKIWARGALKGQADITVLPKLLSFSYLENRGAVWGIFQDKRIFLILLTAVIFLVVLLIYFKLPMKKRYTPARILLVFIAAGGLGNIIDRIAFGYVTDFIRFDFIDFPIFNVADMYITVCEILAIILVFFVYREDLDEKKEAEQKEDHETGKDAAPGKDR